MNGLLYFGLFGITLLMLGESRRHSKAVRKVLNQVDESVFSAFDDDGDNMITEDELLVSLNNSNAERRLPEVVKVFKRADKNKDGQLNLKEAQRFIGGGKMPYSFLSRAVVAIFPSFVSQSKLPEGLEGRLSDKEARALYNKLDRNIGGSLSYAELQDPARIRGCEKAIMALFDLANLSQGVDSDDGYVSFKEANALVKYRFKKVSLLRVMKEIMKIEVPKLPKKAS